MQTAGGHHLCSHILERRRAKIGIDAQFAHRPGRNTDLLLETKFAWTELIDMSRCFDVVYFGLKATFERATHLQLLNCLSASPFRLIRLTDRINLTTFY